MEDIIEQLDNLGKGLYYKWGPDSYNERCQLHDIENRLSDMERYAELSSKNEK